MTINGDVSVSPSFRLSRNESPPSRDAGSETVVMLLARVPAASEMMRATKKIPILCW